MFGIYCFINKINNKKYIGQSVNLQERYKAHLRNYDNPNHASYSSKFYRALRKYGIKNFDYKILYQKSFMAADELDQLEIYFIQKYDSFNNGYNMSKGGRYTFGPKILKEEDIYKIHKLLKDNKITFKKIGEKFNVSDGTISLINSGVIWVLPNVIYPIRVNTYSHNRGGLNPNAKLSDNFVLKLRQEYVTSSLTDLNNKYPNIPFSTIKKAVYGVQYKHLPIYKKRSKKWYLNGTCIDYPRLEE